MFRKIFAFVLICAPLGLVTCSGNGGVNLSNMHIPDNLADSFGGKNSQYIKAGIAAGGHLLNAAGSTKHRKTPSGNPSPCNSPASTASCRTVQLQKYVSLVGLTVASASSRPAGNYVFGVLNTPVVNAFSGPNGYIFIMRGALAHMQDEAELAGVLGHEISHVIHHDGLHLLQEQEETGALKSALSAAHDDSGQLSALTDAGIDVVTKDGYSHPQEFAADESGVAHHHAAGYDPESYLRFLQRLDALEASSGKSDLFSTHPAVNERVGRVAAELKTLPKGGATLADRFAHYVRQAGY